MPSTRAATTMVHAATKKTKFKPVVVCIFLKELAAPALPPPG
jgi:hypothetical protein